MDLCAFLQIFTNAKRMNSIVRCFSVFIFKTFTWTLKIAFIEANQYSLIDLDIIYFE